MSTSVRLDEETRRRIKALASRFGCSEAAIMRQSIERGLAELERVLAIPSPAEKD